MHSANLMHQFFKRTLKLSLSNVHENMYAMLFPSTTQKRLVDEITTSHVAFDRCLAQLPISINKPQLNAFFKELNWLDVTSLLTV